VNTTSNLGLKKPEQTEFYNVDDFNDNADVIDSKFSPSTGHKHTGAAGDAPQIGTDGIADGAVTAAKVGPDVATKAELDAVSAVANAAKTRADAALPKDGSEAFTGDFSASKPRANIAGTNQYAFFNGKQRAHLCSNAYNDGEWKRYDTALPAAALIPLETGKLQINFAPAGANPIVWTTYEVFHTGNDGAGSELDANTVRGYVPVNKAGDTIAWLNIDGSQGPWSTASWFKQLKINPAGILWWPKGTASRSIAIGRTSDDILRIMASTADDGSAPYDNVMTVDMVNKIAFINSKQIWDESRLRTTNGYLEVLIGGSWIPVGNIQVGRPRSASATVAAGTAAGTYVTLLNLSGVSGRLDMLRGWSRQSAGGTLRVTVDGKVDVWSFPGSGGSSSRYLSYYLGDHWNNSGTGEIPMNNAYVRAQEPIEFYNSVKVEVAPGAVPPDTVFTSGADVVYALKAGTP